MRNFQFSKYNRPIPAELFGAILAVGLLIALCAVLATAQTGTSSTATFQGNVMSWLDGDTVNFRKVGGKYLRVRLAGIDAVETRQSFGLECKQILREATEGKNATLTVFGQDVYKRWLGRISVEGIPDVNLYMIEQGCAWEYGASLDVKTSYQDAEQTARESQTGLWADLTARSPWSFRNKCN